MKLSIVLPIYNEAGAIAELIRRIAAACESFDPFEIICVDDGSTDETFEELRKAKASYPQVVILRFEKNCGQSDALAAGFQESRGEIVATLDSDLQDPPEDIPTLIAALKDYDAVIGWREKRQDKVMKAWASRFANRFRNAVLKDNAKDTGCPLKVFRSSCVKSLPLFRGGHRFIPALLQMKGCRVRQIPVRHFSRTSGVTKYSTLGRALPAFVDLIGVSWLKCRRLKYVIKEKVS